MKKQGELECKIESLKGRIWGIKRELYGENFYGCRSEGEQHDHEKREPRLKELESIRGTEADTVEIAEERVRLQISEKAYQDKVANLKDLEDELQKVYFAICAKMAKKFRL